MTRRRAHGLHFVVHPSVCLRAPGVSPWGVSPQAGLLGPLAVLCLFSGLGCWESGRVSLGSGEWIALSQAIPGVRQE